MAPNPHPIPVKPIYPLGGNDDLTFKNVPFRSALWRPIGNRSDGNHEVSRSITERSPASDQSSISCAQHSLDERQESSSSGKRSRHAILVSNQVEEDTITDTEAKRTKVANRSGDSADRLEVTVESDNFQPRPSDDEDETTHSVQAVSVSQELIRFFSSSTDKETLPTFAAYLSPEIRQALLESRQVFIRLEKDKELWSSRAYKAENELELSRTEVAYVKEKYLGAKEAICTKEKTLISLIERIEVVSSSHASELAQAGEQLQQATSAKELLRDRKQTLLNEIREEQDRHAKLSEDYTNLQQAYIESEKNSAAKVDQLEQEAKQFRTQQITADTEIASLKREVNKLLEELNDLNDLHESTNETRDKWMSLATQREAANSDLVKEKASLEREIAELKASHNAIQSSRHQVQARKGQTELERKLATAEERVTNLRLQVASGEDQLEKGKDLRRSIEKRLSTQEKLVKDKDRMLESGKARYGELIKEYGTYKERTEEQLTRTEKELREKNDTVQRLFHDLETTRRTLRDTGNQRETTQLIMKRIAALNATAQKLLMEHEASSDIRAQLADEIASKNRYLTQLRGHIKQSGYAEEHWVTKSSEECQDYLKKLNALGAREREMDRLFESLR
ncbi:uncharacterized protein I303_100285 [Kwoniella dejecticola CBS 10117]|uniref:Uncharacterized protein n=1 Tax=Kwoniella dejecticola CBS 10117 TaxID=1296121 RepID=A0A1A6AEL3_9TREE|nr:uncharacterized protein I303_00285 [Kwoniella dejecticola CBS 10117]OBR88468.1 hypothetical protein I303_00285 [Kwoniella dejecticola CBS 10117]